MKHDQKDYPVKILYVYLNLNNILLYDINMCVIHVLDFQELQ